ncbi:MAG: DNA mismatch repair protein MutS [Bryobacterales bacterium]|nr:DNA mismatch repair protein MutS [Bryobacterales bacterium]
MGDPHSEYQQRHARALARTAALAAQSDRFSTWRGIVGIALLAAAWGAWRAWWPVGVIMAPVAAFAALAILHERLARRQGEAQRAVSYYERGLERIEGRWQGHGLSAGAVYRDNDHVYAEDLDLFGPGSLFELISLARTLPGEARLAQWLKEPAAREEALARQAAVADLRARVDLREDLALAGEEARAELHADALRKWGEAAPAPFPPAAGLLLPLVVLINIAAFIAWAAGAAPSAILLTGVLLAGIVTALCREAITQVIGDVSARPRDLALLAAIMHRLERELFSAPKLVELRGLFAGAEREIARLQQLVEWHDMGRNQMLAIPAFYLAWSPLLCRQIELWRRRNGAALSRWIDAVAELEALSSLSGFAYEHPAAVFPDLLDSGNRFEAEGLAHPLIGEAKAVANDVSFGGELRMLLISGSNMSGKSTLLRSVGLNTVLAWAGGPVRAKKLAVSPLALGASVRATDSLLEGRSRFFAEILRLKQIQKLTAGPRPVLFLLDELLSGTNSHDRAVGADNYLNGLVDRGAVGLATTHDLALTQVADRMGEHAKNLHLADTIRDGDVLFDYRLRPGVVQRGNALALMRAVGLDVKEPPR